MRSFHIPLDRVGIRRNSRHDAFTLVELLIVIGIILILIGILVPLVGKVRIAVQSANTRQMLSRLEAGIESYETVFGSYPGVFANYQVSPFLTTTPHIGDNTTPQLQLSSTNATGAAPVTSTENLYLSLAGGLGITTANTPPIVSKFFFTDSLGQDMSGPGNLNPGNIKRYGAFMTFKADETSYPMGSNPAQPANSQGVWNTPVGASTPAFTGDTVVPEFLDKYSSPQPILYMRANRGATGMSDQTNAAAYQSGFQYQPAQIATTYSSRNATGQSWAVNNIDFLLTGVFTQPFDPYIGNPDLSATVATPFQKEGYILISAGPDGIYGTKDDITNFR